MPETSGSGHSQLTLVGHSFTLNCRVMDKEFADAFEELRERWYGKHTMEWALASTDAEIQHATHSQRSAEATAVVPVARAFAEAELAPADHERGLGIYGSPNLVPPLYTQLGKRLRKATPDELQAARYAIYMALAAGYVGFMSVEADNRISYRPSEAARIWSVTVHNFRGEGLASVGLPSSFAATLEKHGEHDVVVVLRDAGLLGRRVGRVGLLGRYYANAGGFMRAAQTDWGLGPRANLNASVLEEMWPYERYEVADRR